LVHTGHEFRANAATALVGAGYTVTAFDSSSAALAAVESGSCPDFLITCARFPPDAPSGLSLARAAVLKRPQVRILVTGEPAFAPIAQSVGAFLNDPVDLPDLLAAVRGLFPGGERQFRRWRK